MSMHEMYTVALGAECLSQRDMRFLLINHVNDASGQHC